MFLIPNTPMTFTYRSLEPNNWLQYRRCTDERSAFSIKCKDLNAALLEVYRNIIIGHLDVPELFTIEYTLYGAWVCHTWIFHKGKSQYQSVLLREPGQGISEYVAEGSQRSFFIDHVITLTSGYYQ